MQKKSVEQLKKTIIAAEAEQFKREVVFRAEGAELKRNRLASEKIAAAWLRNSGLDLDQLEVRRKRHEAELDRLVEKHKSEALRQAARTRNKLHAEIAAQSKALRELAGRRDFFPHPSFSLDTPFLIWTTPLMELTEAVAAPFGSFAKFKFSTSATRGTQKVSFYFLWANPFQDYAVINATTFLSSVGHLKTHASWGLTVNSSELIARARFGIWFGVQNDVNATGYATEFLGRSGSLSAPLIGGDTSGRSINKGSTLSKTMFPVPPGTVAVFEVALALEYDNDSGNVEANFLDGDFRLQCPVVVFSLLNSPSSQA